MLGSSFVGALTATDEHAPLVIGRDRFSRLELAELGITHMRACYILSGIAKDLGSKSVRHLFDHSSPYTFATYPAGVTTLFVVFAVFQAEGLSVRDWYAAGKDKAVTTFVTLKKKELEATARTKRAARKRAASAA